MRRGKLIDNAPAAQRLHTFGPEEFADRNTCTLAQVRFAVELDDDLRAVCGDYGALLHALMNLCVNAIDAMPCGGTLTRRTRNAEPGYPRTNARGDHRRRSGLSRCVASARARGRRHRGPAHERPRARAGTPDAATKASGERHSPCEDQTMLGIAVWITMGAVVGFVASILLKTDEVQRNIAVNVAASVGGAVIGGTIARFLGYGGTRLEEVLSFQGVLFAGVGAAAMLVAANVLALRSEAPR